MVGQVALISSKLTSFVPSPWAASWPRAYVSATVLGVLQTYRSRRCGNAFLLQAVDWGAGPGAFCVGAALAQDTLKAA